MRSMVKMRGRLHAFLAFKIFSLPIPTRPGTRTFLQVPDPSRPKVKNPYPPDPGQDKARSEFVMSCHSTCSIRSLNPVSSYYYPLSRLSLQISSGLGTQTSSWWRWWWWRRARQCLLSTVMKLSDKENMDQKWKFFSFWPMMIHCLTSQCGVFLKGFF